MKNFKIRQRKKSKTIERFKIRKGEKEKAEPFFRSRLEDDPGTKSSEAYPSAAPAWSLVVSPGEPGLFGWRPELDPA